MIIISIVAAVELLLLLGLGYKYLQCKKRLTTVSEEAVKKQQDAISKIHSLEGKLRNKRTKKNN